MKKTKKIKRKTSSQLRKELDKLFSEFIRRRDGGKCVTCGKETLWKQSQAGHYISRSALATRFDEQNVHCQCVGCNIFKKGNMPAYTIFLQKKFGNEIIEELLKKSKVITTDFPYQERIDFYKKLV